ncbi:MAG: hypothetical protein IPK26_10780 [Planctomycetes bacterium]|nr:hypothetical protein [Planctomycetota bacterium]
MRSEGSGPTLRAAECVLVPAGGSAEQSFPVEAGKVRLVLLGAAGKPVANVPLSLLDATGQKCHQTGPTDAQGACEIEVETTPFTVAVLPRRLQDRQAQMEVQRANRGVPDPFDSLRIPLASVTATRDGPVVVELRLPSGR